MGVAEGKLVGVADGNAEGAILGVDVGMNVSVGCDVGLTGGFSVGAFVGVVEGSALGCFVGLGALMGFGDGEPEARGLGAAGNEGARLKVMFARDCVIFACAVSCADRWFVPSAPDVVNSKRGHTTSWNKLGHLNNRD